MKKKFICSITISAVLLVFSFFFVQRWASDASALFGTAYTWFFIFSVALLPGFLMSGMFFSNLLNFRLKHFSITSQDVTILVCAHNEQHHIADCIRKVLSQNYQGHIYLKIIDNACTDSTAEIVKTFMKQSFKKISIELIPCEKLGKYYALNHGLKYVRTPYFITLDADTLLHNNAVQQIMNCIITQEHACVGGNLLLANTKQSFITKMQNYDYILSIAAIKRYQGSYNATLVAQGAFSAYCTKAVRNVGGWKACVGEDITLTYQLLQAGGTSGYEPRAVGYTFVPDNLSHLYHQRKRWAYGMFEGYHFVKPWQQSDGITSYFSWIPLIVTLLDAGYILGFLPGCILAILGYPVFAGIYTLISLLFSFPALISFYWFQKSLHIPFQNTFLGFFLFLFFFQFISSIAALHGYFLFLFHRTNIKWK